MPATRPVVRSAESTSSRYRTWMAALDQLGLPVILFDGDGQEIHRTAALAAMLAREPAPFDMRVLAAARQIADERLTGSSAHAVQDAVQLIADGPTPADTRPHAARRYSVRALFINEPENSGAAPDLPLLLVALERRSPRLPSTDLLRAQFSLTRREADVALLLAQRMHNAEIAEALCVSVHTARHHTAQVLEKLNIHRRTDVARLVQNIETVSAG